MALNSQLSKSLSSSTLLRGADLLRSATMSIEADSQLAAMQEELAQLKVALLCAKLFDSFLLVRKHDHRILSLGCQGCQGLSYQIGFKHGHLFSDLRLSSKPMVRNPL